MFGDDPVDLGVPREAAMRAADLEVGLRIVVDADLPVDDAVGPGIHGGLADGIGETFAPRTGEPAHASGRVALVVVGLVRRK